MFNFTPSTIPNNVFIIGAGGTGGRLIPMLTQFMRSITRGMSPTGWLESPKIWLIDDDVVEQKNILRQNFIDRDVGKHKAVVLAERYSKAYGVNVIPIPTRITTASANEFYKTVNDHLFIMNGNIDTVKFNNIVGNSIVIICVDSVEARRDILNVFIPKNTSRESVARTFFIDSGNEDNFGQVSFFTSTVMTKSETRDKTREIPKLCPVSENIDYIPLPVEYYRDLEDTPAQGSCADLNQTLAINAIMATTIMGILQNYFYRKPMSYNSVSISLDGGNATTYNTFNVLNSKGIDSEAMYKIRARGISSKEKDGTVKPLSFVNNANQVDGEVLRDSLLKKMEDIIREAEKVRRKAEAEAARKAEDERIKVIAARKRAEIRAQVEAAKRLKDDPNAPIVEMASSAGAPISVAPPLVASPRRRAARNVVELPPVVVPASWNNVVEDEDREYNEDDDS